MRGAGSHMKESGLGERAEGGKKDSMRRGKNDVILLYEQLWFFVLKSPVYAQLLKRKSPSIVGLLYTSFFLPAYDRYIYPNLEDRRGVEEVSLERIRVILSSPPIISLSLPVDWSEARKISVPGLAIHFPKLGVVDRRDGAQVLRCWQSRMGGGR